jgi:hypothetical protein
MSESKKSLFKRLNWSGFVLFMTLTLLAALSNKNMLIHSGWDYVIVVMILWPISLPIGLFFLIEGRDH